MEKTSKLIKKATDTLKRKREKGSRYDHDDMDRVEWLNDMSRESDWDSWMSDAMIRIELFFDSYRDDGTPKRNINGITAFFLFPIPPKIKTYCPDGKEILMLDFIIF